MHPSTWLNTFKATLEAHRNKARRARVSVSNALRDGRLHRPDACAACGTLCQPEAHHPDYNLPLDVEWLCRPCHRARHRTPRSIVALMEAA